MRISDWSSDVCSSDLQRRTNLIPVIGADAGRRRKTLGSHVTDLAMAALEKETLRLFSCPTSGFDHPPMPLAHDQQAADRQSVVSGKSVSVRVDLGGRRLIKKKPKKVHKNNHKI